MGKAASLNPETFVEGGGLLDDVNVTMEECSFEMYDYNGKSPQAVPALKLHLDVEDMEEPVDQYYSMGSPKDWMPSDDGSQLVAIGQTTSIRSSSNGGIFLKSLIDAGFPAEELGDDISALNGLQAHMIRVPAPKRPGIQKKKREDGREFEETILIVGEIVAMPGEKKKPKGAPKSKASSPKAAPKAKPKAAPKAAPKEEEGDVGEKATLTILDLLETEESIAKKDLPGKIFQVMKNDPDRNAVVKMVFDDEFLGSGPWAYEDGVIVAA